MKKALLKISTMFLMSSSLMFLTAYGANVDNRFEIDQPIDILETVPEFMINKLMEDNSKIEDFFNVITVDHTEPSETVTDEAATVSISPQLCLSNEDIDLIALVTMAEAEAEPEKGKRLVIDTIINRVRHGGYPNTVRGVIYQKGAFTSMWNGRVNRCYVRDDIRQLVLEELNIQVNYETIFFRTGRYSSYGTPMFKEGNHYFSSY